MSVQEAEELMDAVKDIRFDSSLFTIRLNEDKVIFGASMKDDPGMDSFFCYGTIWRSVIDLDCKIKISLIAAIELVKGFNLIDYDPFASPSWDEMMSMYYTENAVFRTSIIWDMLAQLYNLKHKVGKRPEKIYCTSFFRDQSKKDDGLAKEIYEYLDQEEDLSVEPCRGNYKFVSDYRNKLAHRNSPNISSVSSFDLELRLPMAFVLKRVIEDYKKAAFFINALVHAILKGY